MKRSVRRFKPVVFTARRVLAYFPFATSSKCLSLSTVWWNPPSLHQQLMKDSKFGLTFWLSLRSPHVKPHAFRSSDWYLPSFSRQMKSTWCWSAPPISVPEEAAETIWRAVNAVSTCRNTFNFFDYLEIFRHYFTGDGKVSCILATVSDWFPNIKI